MSAPDSLLLEQVLERAQGRFGWLSRPTLRRCDDFEGPYSHVSRLTLEADGHAEILYLKRLKHEGLVDEGLKQRTLSEYGSLLRFSSQFQSHPNFRVAHPLAAFPEYAALLMEEAKGTSLMRLIGRSCKRYHPRGRFDQVERYCILAGRWLREFQASTRCDDGRFDLERLIGYCDARFAVLICDPNSGIDEPFRARFEERLRRNYAENRAKVEIIAGCHHDYSPHNILAADRRITIIDLGNFALDSRLYDLCRFWFQLECLKASPVFSRPRITCLQAAFFAGYGEMLDTNDPAFQLVVSAHVLARLGTMTTGGTRGGLKAWIDRRLYQRWLQWLRLQR